MDADQEKKYVLVGVNQNGNKFLYAGWVKPDTRENVDQRRDAALAVQENQVFSFIIEEAQEWGLE